MWRTRARTQALAGGVEDGSVPSGGEHGLSEDQVNVFALADGEADPRVHLRPYPPLLLPSLEAWRLGASEAGENS